MLIDGNLHTPGTELCQCAAACEMPCWQRIGLAPPCVPCGCLDRHADDRRMRHLQEHGITSPLPWDMLKRSEQQAWRERLDEDAA